MGYDSNTKTGEELYNIFSSVNKTVKSWKKIGRMERAMWNRFADELGVESESEDFSEQSEDFSEQSEYSESEKSEKSESENESEPIITKKKSKPRSQDKKDKKDEYEKKTKVELLKEAKMNNYDIPGMYSMKKDKLILSMKRALRNGLYKKPKVTKAELIAIAGKLGMKGVSHLRKDDLERAIKRKKRNMNKKG